MIQFQKTILHTFFQTLCLLLLSAEIGATEYNPSDISLSLPAGGVSPKKNGKALTIKKQHLFISPSEIRIIATVCNETDTALESEMEFVLPYRPHSQLGSQTYWDPEIIVAAHVRHAKTHSWTLDPQNQERTPFGNLKIFVDSTPVPLKMSVKAIKNQSDVTELLQSSGLPLSPDVAACKNLPLVQFEQKECEERIEKLKEIGLLDNETPLWTKKIFYSWTQNFPPSKDVVIEFTYRPATGFVQMHFDDDRPPLESLVTGLLSASPFFANTSAFDHSNPEADLVGWMIKKYSIDLQQPEKNRGTYFYQVDYLLKTSHFSEDPIKEFILTIDHPEDGVAQASFLWPKMRLKRVSPTRLQTIRYNYLPKENVSVFFGSPKLIPDIL